MTTSPYSITFVKFFCNIPPNFHRIVYGYGCIKWL